MTIVSQTFDQERGEGSEIEIRNSLYDDTITK